MKKGSVTPQKKERCEGQSHIDQMDPLLELTMLTQTLTLTLV